MQRLPDEVLSFMRVVTHTHPYFAANPSCCGTQSLAEVILATSQLGLEGVALAEHTSDPTHPRSVGDDDPLVVILANRRHRIIRESRWLDLRVFPGFEYSIMQDGTLDVDPACLPLHLVTASQHGGLGDAEKDPLGVYRRLVAAARNPLVDIIGHPTRHNDDVDGVPWADICAECDMYNTAIELNFNLWFKDGPGQDEKSGWDAAALDWYGTAKDFWHYWLSVVAASGVAVSIGLDIHNLGMWPQDPPPDPWSPPVAKLVEFIDLIKSAGISPSRIINANLETFAAYIGAAKEHRHLILDDVV